MDTVVVANPGGSPTRRCIRRDGSELQVVSGINNRAQENREVCKTNSAPRRVRYLPKKWYSEGDAPDNDQLLADGKADMRVMARQTNETNLMASNMKAPPTKRTSFDGEPEDINANPSLHYLITRGRKSAKNSPSSDSATISDTSTAHKLKDVIAGLRSQPLQQRGRHVELIEALLSTPYHSRTIERSSLPLYSQTAPSDRERESETSEPHAEPELVLMECKGKGSLCLPEDPSSTPNRKALLALSRRMCSRSSARSFGSEQSKASLTTSRHKGDLHFIVSRAQGLCHSASCSSGRSAGGSQKDALILSTKDDYDYDDGDYSCCLSFDSDASFHAEGSHPSSSIPSGEADEMVIDEDTTIAFSMDSVDIRKKQFAFVRHNGAVEAQQHGIEFDLQSLDDSILQRRFHVRANLDDDVTSDSLSSLGSAESRLEEQNLEGFEELHGA